MSKVQIGNVDTNNTWGPTIRKQKVNEWDLLLTSACKTGNILDAEKALLKGANPSRIISLAMGQTTPLFIASQNGHIKIAELLLKKSNNNININQTVGWDGQTCLHHATNNKHIKMCQFLINNKADVDIQDRLKRTPLFDAAEMGNIDILNILINNGAKIDVQSSGYTPLQHCLDYASEKDDESKRFLEICQILMKNGADIDRQGKETGRSLLMIACGLGKIDLINELINERNADIHLLDNYNKSALMYAKEYSQTQAQQILLKKIEEENKKSKCIIL